MKVTTNNQFRKVLRFSDLPKKEQDRYPQEMEKSKLYFVKSSFGYICLDDVVCIEEAFYKEYGISNDWIGICEMEGCPHVLVSLNGDYSEYKVGYLHKE